MDYLKTYEEWCANATEINVVKWLKSMKNDNVRKEYAFSSALSFGTAGLRGIMDAGTNCLNAYTIALTTFGVYKYMESINGKVAVICYDSRNNSKYFAEIAATVLANNGISVKITSQLQPTPVLSYCVRHYKAAIGIMITASHNSREYNGYKVYAQKGVQIDVDTAEIITKYISATNPFDVDFKGLQRHFDTGLVSYVEDDIYNDYLDEVSSQLHGKIEKLRVVFSPLNGAGHQLVPEALKRAGLANLTVVPEQSYPNGDFTTCASPNPEKFEALKLGIDLVKSTNADILIATDPDSDRVGVAVRHDKSVIQLSGNEVGILLTEYLLTVRKQDKTLPKKPIVVKTIVTSRLIDDIMAANNGVSVSLLTGFKYIGDYIGQLEEKGEKDRFLLGFEESCGYLVGSYARDKDAVVASALICCMASYYLKQRKTLIDQLNTIYFKYGACQNAQHLFRFDGTSGEIKRKEYMEKLHATKVSKIANLEVLSTIDLTKENSMNLPYADVIIYNLAENSQIIVRPSGTEPLIKIYMSSSYDDKNAQVLFDLIVHCFTQFFSEKE